MNNCLLKINRRDYEEIPNNFVKKSELKNIIKGIITEISAEIYNKKDFDPENPEVLLRGIGRYSKKELESNIVGKLEDLVMRAKNGEWTMIQRILKDSVLHDMVNGMVDIQNELNTPVMKRKISLKKMQKRKDPDGVLVENKLPIKDHSILINSGFRWNPGENYYSRNEKEFVKYNPNDDEPYMLEDFTSDQRSFKEFKFRSFKELMELIL